MIVFPEPNTRGSVASPPGSGIVSESGPVKDGADSVSRLPLPSTKPRLVNRNCARDSSEKNKVLHSTPRASRRFIGLWLRCRQIDNPAGEGPVSLREVFFFRVAGGCVEGGALATRS